MQINWKIEVLTNKMKNWGFDKKNHNSTEKLRFWQKNANQLKNWGFDKKNAYQLKNLGFDKKN